MGCTLRSILRSCALPHLRARFDTRPYLMKRPLNFEEASALPRRGLRCLTCVRFTSRACFGPQGTARGVIGMLSEVTIICRPSKTVAAMSGKKV